MIGIVHNNVFSFLQEAGMLAQAPRDAFEVSGNMRAIYRYYGVM